MEREAEDRAGNMKQRTDRKGIILTGKTEGTEGKIGGKGRKIRRIKSGIN